MIWPLWKLTTFVVVGELIAIAINAWQLWEHWNDPVFFFILKAVNLAVLCGVATGAFCALARAYQRDKEHRDGSRNSG
jgi:hypothetical protein